MGAWSASQFDTILGSWHVIWLTQMVEAKPYQFGDYGNGGWGL
jgi:hypothetical protein